MANRATEIGPRGDWPEPQPTDGPEYHADHAFWREAMTRHACPGCGRGTGLCVDCTEDGVFGHQVIPPAQEHRRVHNGKDTLDTCTDCDWESWDTAPPFEEHVLSPAEEQR